ncbi:MAG TPA: ABC transporter ATP-binding protein [Nitrososphaerales archaeon]|nr:ABC transporter ATP-binding protein [Nitrososphaerales archaeon]
MIVASSLTRNFGSFTAVEDLSLTIERGEIFGFLGPNGAGKTTTMRMLTGLISPSRGTAKVDDLDVSRLQNIPQIHRNVGVLPEVPGLYEDLSAYRNLDFYGRLFGLKDPKLRERIMSLMQTFELWERREDLVQTFSKGMKQKIAVIRCLLHDPEYLFLDEPVSGLDPEASKTVRDFILDLKKNGKTVILSTHNLDDADRLCDRVAVIRKNLIALDTPLNLRTRMFKRTVVFHLKEADDAAIQKIKTLPFVQSAERSGNKLVLDLDNPEENNPEILELLIKNGYKVQFVGEIRHSLEEVYLKLVNN